QHPDDRRDARHLERDLRPVEQAQELVVSGRVGRSEDEEGVREVADCAGIWRRRDPAEGTHRQQRSLVDAAREELVVRPVPEVVRRDRPAGERAEDEEQEEAAAGDRDPVAAEAEPDELPVAARANCSNDVDTDLAVRLGGDRRRKASRRRDELRTFGRGHPRAASYSTRPTMSLAASKSKAPLVQRFWGDASP